MKGKFQPQLISPLDKDKETKRRRLVIRQNPEHTSTIKTGIVYFSNDDNSNGDVSVSRSRMVTYPSWHAAAIVFCSEHKGR